MLFNSVDYLLLLVPCLLCYWLVPSIIFRQCTLFVGSVYFYYCWNNVFAALLLFMVCINWLLGFLVERNRNRFVLAIAIGFNLAVLCYFKYANFVIENFLKLYGLVNDISSPDGPYFSVILPLGLSFFVFEFISYFIDLYRKTITAERNPIVFALFVMFFPHLIAGPICRANSIFPQFKTVIRYENNFIVNGIFIFLCGLFLKVVIADNLSPFVDETYANLTGASSLKVVIAVLTFSLVILCDFWGYSTMALGSAIMFGINLPINFDLPYISTSLQEFWRRWHITLSMWLRDYLYISLGGARSGKLKTYRNLFLVMLIGGIWHGAGWCFLIWGCAHGAWLAIERAVSPFIDKIRTNEYLKSILGWLLTFTFVTLAWVPFRLNDIQLTFLAFDKILSLNAQDFSTARQYSAVFIYILMFIFLHYPINLYTKTLMGGGQLSLAKKTVFAFWLSILIIVFGSTTVESFIYFQF